MSPPFERGGRGPIDPDGKHRLVLGAVAFIEASGPGTAETAIHAVRAGGGEIVQRLGELLIACFDSARACLRCASALPAGEVRAGLSAGDVSIEGDFLHGLPVIEASRLKDLAEPGQILCTARLARLAATGAEAPGGGAREIRLKGINEPVAVVTLR